MVKLVSERLSVALSQRITVGEEGGGSERRSARSQRRRPGGAGERYASSLSATKLMEPVWVIRTGTEPEGRVEGGGVTGRGGGGGVGTDSLVVSNSRANRLCH